MRNTIFFFFVLLHGLAAQRDYASLVNPFIGTGGHGHTYPGVSMPFGMVQLSPDTRMDDWDGCGGYHYSDSLVYGFSHTHLSGTGVPDYCDVLVQPFTGQVVPWEKEAYRSGFRHETEQARAGYYAVTLDRQQIRAELTATPRTGLHRYTYTAGTTTGRLLIDLNHRDPLIDAHIEMVDAHTIRGWRFSKSWASNQKLYFVMQFDRKISSYDTTIDPRIQKNTKMALSFQLKKDGRLLVKTGISAVSIEGAMRNLKAEQKGFHFEQVLKKATETWQKELAKIEIETDRSVQDTIFYTALYHTMLAPNLYQDVDGQYRGHDDQVHTAAPGHEQYTVFSLWDTHRALHPLMSIIDKRRTGHWVNTFLDYYKYKQKLPVWELAANETNCMIGYHAVPVIVDAWNKDVRNFDPQLALAAMSQTSHGSEFGISDYGVTGFLSNEREAESVSKTLEYAFDDGCIADFAAMHGRKDVQFVYQNRALNYRNLFNPATGFFHGKIAANWYTPFDPREVNHFYTEGNAWHYAFTAQQDLGGLIDLYGGHEAFGKKLIAMFNDVGLTGRDQADVTGLIGQYAQGNEPSHHIAWLFNYTEQPAFGHRLIQGICSEMYQNTPDGLIGNEDCGQMSAWYIFSSLGFYPVHPANNQFAIGAPQVRKATIHLENGKQFTITADRAAPLHHRIGKCTVNGVSKTQLQLDYAEIRDGGQMHVQLTPGKGYALKGFDRLVPKALPRTGFVEVPFVVNESYKFTDSVSVSLQSIDKEAVIYYCTQEQGGALCSAFGKYSGPISRSANSFEVRFYAQRGGAKSTTASQMFYKLPTDRSIEVLSKVDPMYTDGGNISLIDGILGTTNWRAGHWQSYHGNDFEAILDLKTERAIKSASGLFLQETRSWIWSPKSMEVATSTDGKNFTICGTAAATVSPTDETSQTTTLQVQFPSRSARYVRFRAKNIGPIPEWHVGRGDKAHLFVSEVVVN
jgi:predicted alpha-1,2-mannosidase